MRSIFSQTVVLAELLPSSVLLMLVLGGAFLPVPSFLILSLLAGLLIFLLSQGRLKRGFLRTSWPLFGVVVLGLTRSADHEMHNILRDIVFMVSPISVLFIGYWLEGKISSLAKFIRSLTGCGLVLALIHGFQFVLQPELFGADVITIRNEAGVGYSLVTVALILALFQRRIGLEKVLPFHVPRWGAIILLMMSLVLSFSRSQFLVAILLILALYGAISRISVRMIVSVIVVSVGLLVVLLATPSDELNGTTIRGKIARSVTEIAVADYSADEDINQNWRGFETYKAMQTFFSGSVAEQLIGQGLGATVDLGFYMRLQEVDLRYIPVLHNGYMYVLIKSGVLGLLLCLLFFYKVTLQGRSHNHANNMQTMFVGRLLVGCAWSLAFTMFVVGGLYENGTFSPMLLLIGYLASYTGRVRKKEWVMEPANCSRV